MSKFSFAFDVRDNGTVTLEDGTKANELRDLELFEISCVCVPANDDAGVVDVKAGRRNSAKDADAIRQAIALLQSVLDDEDSDDGEDKPEANEASEEPKASNPEKEDLLAYIKNMEV